MKPQSKSASIAVILAELVFTLILIELACKPPALCEMRFDATQDGTAKRANSLVGERDAHDVPKAYISTSSQPERGGDISPQNAVAQYPRTPRGVLKAYIGLCLIGSQEITPRSDSIIKVMDASRRPYPYENGFYPNDEDVLINRQSHVFDSAKQWGYGTDRANVVTGYELTDVSVQGRLAKATVKFKRVAWISRTSPLILRSTPFFRLTNDYHVDTYLMARPGKFWRIISFNDVPISISMAITELEHIYNGTSGIVGLPAPLPYQKKHILEGIKTLKKILKQKGCL
jgi:hypothetical protein